MIYNIRICPGLIHHKSNTGDGSYLIYDVLVEGYILIL